MTIEQYINNIAQRYKQGNATEHTFRGDLQQLIESLVPDITATNEPKRQTCGAPDYILTRKDIPVGFIEAKDIGDKDLDGLKKTGNKEQFDRYKASLSNLIFTDYLSFHLYREGQFVTKISIAELVEPSTSPSPGLPRLNSGDKAGVRSSPSPGLPRLNSGERAGVRSSDRAGVRSLPNNFAAFTNLIKDFCTHISQTIKSPKRLAEMMAGKARLLADVIEKALTSDEDTHHDSSLKEQMMAFRDILIHDITPKGFSDVYAQTIAYGMFAARLHDPTLPTFSRQEAAELIPKSNPFLRKLFGYIAGPDIDDRIKWIVDSLIEIFLASNVEELLRNYGKSTKTEDPIIHFYETFLSEYDPRLRKARGVWYTPQPVVSFIVRAVDDILKTEFGLPMGLADTSKTKVQVKVMNKATADQRSKLRETTIEEEVHRVQILDPATGTGTFLAEVIKQVHSRFQGQQGIWSSYVETHLLPRLNGFELLMASYAMAHLQLDLLLTGTGYRPTRDQRFRVFLTNSLEEHHPDTGTLFANWLSTEANEANRVKRDTPVMCVIGNPPYSGESANKGEWIMKLMEDYKKEPGGVERLKERNPKWINDDYVKFLRYGQHFIEKNGSGVLAFINPHGYLDNPTFRGMRWHLLKTYDKIYTIDLHGNSNKKETAPDGSADENVFDIQQGVSINIFVKTGRKKDRELGKVYHYDLFGKREEKYAFLQKNSLKSVPYKEMPNLAPNYYFLGKDFEEQKAYDKGFRVNELFSLNNVGIVTARDEFTIHSSKKEVENIIKEFLRLDDETARRKFNLGSDVRDWQVNYARKDLEKHFPDKGLYTRISYRPFDHRWTFYTGKSKGFHCYPRNEVMQHLIKGENVGLSLCRQLISNDFHHAFITNGVVDDSYVSNKSRERGYVFPLYLYPEPNAQLTTEEQPERRPNLNMEIVKQIAKQLNHIFLPDENIECDLPAGVDGTFSPLNILDYIYAVLHSPSYRSKYKEFLKIDFPRVPYPSNAKQFWKLVKLGSQLRTLHLLESPVVEKLITQYPVDGSNVVEKVSFQYHIYCEELPDKNGKYPDYLGTVYINDTQFFNDVPSSAWNFYIGGYQPAQKWLKDRKGRTLTFEDILHYQKIIAALKETGRLMKEVDNVLK